MASSARAALIDVQDEGEPRFCELFVSDQGNCRCDISCSQPLGCMTSVWLKGDAATPKSHANTSFSSWNCNVWTNYPVFRSPFACFQRCSLTISAAQRPSAHVARKATSGRFHWPCFETCYTLLFLAMTLPGPAAAFDRVWMDESGGFFCALWHCDDQWSEGRPDRLVWNAAITACETSSQWILALALLKDMRLAGYRCGNGIPMAFLGAKEWMNNDASDDLYFITLQLFCPVTCFVGCWKRLKFQSSPSSAGPTPLSRTLWHTRPVWAPCNDDTSGSKHCSSCPRCLA